MNYCLFQYDDIKHSGKEVKTLQDEIDKYLHSGKEKQLEDSRTKIAKLERKAAKYEAKKEEISQDIFKIKEEKVKQEVNK